MAEQTHRSDPRTLNQRTLEKDHRRLAALLSPGVSVLDVGCGTGAITRGIAERAGRVVGMDRDAMLLAQAPQDIAGLRFVAGDILAPPPFDERFDIVTAARVLQWISDPPTALRNMVRLTRPGGMVVVLDYNHNKNSWNPECPAISHAFYRAFLDWRSAHGWDNDMGDHLPDLFAGAGLLEVESTVEDQLAGPDFWPHLIEVIGPQFWTPADCAAARQAVAAWAGEAVLSLRAVSGRVAHTPAGGPAIH